MNSPARCRWFFGLCLALGTPASAPAQTGPASELRLLSIESPDLRVNQAFELATAGLLQQLACDTVTRCGPVAGAALATLGLNGVGAFDHARAVLTSLAARQHDDGRIADGTGPEATPGWLLAAQHYWSASGDDVFLETNWPKLKHALRWAINADHDGDGLLDNAAAAPAGALPDTLLTDIYGAALWVAALDALQQLAHGARDEEVRTTLRSLAARAQRSLDERFWIDSLAIYAGALVRPGASAGGDVRNTRALTAWPVAALAFGLLDADRAERMLNRLGSAELTTDWGVRMLSHNEPDFDPGHYSRGAVWPYITGFAALAHYQHHRAWAGFDLVRAAARVTLDFVRGSPPGMLSGATYTALEAGTPPEALASSLFVMAVVRGTLGWQADAHNRAAALEPHLPPAWRSFSAANLRVGPDAVDVIVSREPGTYTINIRRHSAGPPLRLRVAPALPLGARVERIVVNDADVAVQAEESIHDLHAVAELTLTRDAQVEFHYAGGIELGTRREVLQRGDSARALKVLSWQRRGGEYVVDVQGLAGTTDTLQLRAEARIRAVLGSDRFTQSNQRAAVVFTLPPGSGFVRKTLRIRTTI